jgi:uncharacterized protein YdiU (UPF0061 family)
VPLPGGETLAAVYSGHQFGVWAGQLGDGRAHLLGEIVGPQGNWEVQLKGAGMTPYSRMGDGRAVLRSSVREYLASQAMVGLGIPTTRALSLVSADDPVMRETVETAAIVARVAPSFVRFGSFEHWASRKRPDLVRQLADYVIERFYPECLSGTSGVAETPEARYVSFLEAVVRRTALLMASWQVVGFCHGVMNTDNMSILGLTLDYGPYGFMDGFDARHICNHTDTNGRYAWHAQPAVAHWNLYQLANSLYSIVPDAEALRNTLDSFEPTFLNAMQSHMSKKLGLSTWQAGDEVLIDDLWSLMQASHADFSMSFRQLAFAPGLTEATAGQVSIDLGGTVGDGSGSLQPFIDLFVDREAAGAWLTRYRERLALEATPWQQRVSGMLSVNPLYILRNDLAQHQTRSRGIDLQHRCLQGVDAGRQLDDCRSGRAHTLDPHRPRQRHDNIAHRQMSDAFAERDDATNAVRSGDRRERRGRSAVAALDLEDISGINRHGDHLDDHLARTRRTRIIDFDEFKYLARRSEFCETQGFHAVILPFHLT